MLIFVELLRYEVEVSLNCLIKSYFHFLYNLRTFVCYILMLVFFDKIFSQKTVHHILYIFLPVKVMRRSEEVEAARRATSTLACRQGVSIIEQTGLAVYRGPTRQAGSGLAEYSQTTASPPGRLTTSPSLCCGVSCEPSCNVDGGKTRAINRRSDT